MVPAMEDHQDRWPLVGSVIEGRLKTLPESLNEVARRANISANKLREMRNGKPGNYRPATLVKVSLALWDAPNVIQSILDGDEPLVMVEGDGIPTPVTSEAMTAKVLAMAHKLPPEELELLATQLRAATEEVAQAARDGRRVEIDLSLHPEASRPSPSPEPED